jgi:hypothetical protein
MVEWIVLAVVVLLIAGTLRQRARRRALVEYVHQLELHPELGSTEIDGVNNVVAHRSTHSAALDPEAAWNAAVALNSSVRHTGYT